MAKVHIYAVGICGAVSGKGGTYATVLEYKGRIKMISGIVEETTKNHIELVAALEGLKALQPSGKTKAIEIHTRSNYIIASVNKNLMVWNENNWKTSKKQFVKHIEEWTQIFYIKRINPMLTASMDNESKYISKALEEANIKMNEAKLSGIDV